MHAVLSTIAKTTTSCETLVAAVFSCGDQCPPHLRPAVINVLLTSLQQYLAIHKVTSTVRLTLPLLGNLLP